MQVVSSLVRVVVLLKYVSDVTQARSLDQGRMVRDPAQGVLNEPDEHALEAALRLVEAAQAREQVPAGLEQAPEHTQGSHEIIAVTMAPDGGDIAIKKAYQLGATRGIRLSDPALAGSDYFGTTAALSAVIRKLGEQAPIDLVITGMASLDGLGGVIPALLAEDLGWPQLTHATSVDFAPDNPQALAVVRKTDDVICQLQAPLPALVAVTDAANSIRTPNFALIMAARKSPVEQWTYADIEPYLDQGVGQEAARTTVVSASPHPPRPPARMVTDSLDSQGRSSGGQALADYLISNDLV